MRESLTVTWVLSPRSFGVCSTWFVASAGHPVNPYPMFAGVLTKRLASFPPHSTLLRQRSYTTTFGWDLPHPYGGTAIVLDASSPAEVSLWFYILPRIG